MTTPSTPSPPRAGAPTARSTARTGPSGLARHLGAGRWRAVDEGVSSTGRDLVIAATTVVGMAAVLTGPLVWVAAILLLAATIFGTLQVIGDADPSAAEPGIPIESLFLPAVAAIGCLGAIRLVPLGLAIAPALLLTGVLIDRTLVVEAGIAAARQGPTDEDRSRTLVAMLVVALVAFVGVAAIVPGGLAGREPRARRSCRSPSATWSCWRLPTRSSPASSAIAPPPSAVAGSARRSGRP